MLQGRLQEGKAGWSAPGRGLSSEHHAGNTDVLLSEEIDLKCK